MSGVALSAALSAASGVGASPPVLTRGSNVAGAPGLQYLIRNGVVVPAFTRPQPGGSLAAMFSSPGVIATYAADVPRFLNGGNLLRMDAYQCTNLWVGGEVMTSRVMAVSVEPVRYSLTFFGTGTVRLSSANAVNSLITKGGTAGPVQTADFVGLGPDTIMQGGWVAGETPLNITIIGDVRFGTFTEAQTIAGNNTSGAAFYIPSPVTPQTVGIDQLASLSFPALFPAAEGTLVFSCLADYQMGGIPVLFAMSNPAFTSTIALGISQNNFFPFRTIADVPQFTPFLGPTLTRYTVGVTFTRAGRVVFKRNGLAQTVMTGAPDPIIFSRFQITGKMGGALAASIVDYAGYIGPFGYMPGAVSDSDLATLVAAAHAAG